MAARCKNQSRRNGLVGGASSAAAATLAEVLESTSDCIIALDREWRFTFLNKRAAAELLPEVNLLGRNILEVFPQLVETPFWAAYQQVMADREAKRVEGYIPKLGWYEVYAAPIDDGITIFFRNVDSRKRAEEALKGREALFRKTLDHIPQMVWSTLPDGFNDYANRLWYEFTGVQEGATDGTNDGEAWNDVLHPDDQERAWAMWGHSLGTGKPYEIEYRLRHHSGEYRWVLGRAWPERNADGKIVRWYGTCTDIHDRVCAQQALQETSKHAKWASEHDALTLLPNRRAFQAHLQAATFRSMQQSGAVLGVLLIDLDHFKHVNDTLGHPAGDHVLKAFARRLKRAMRADDFVARLGGDEFAIVSEQIGDEKNLVRLGASIIARLQTPVKFDGRVICGSASIGGVLFPRDGSTANELLKNADTALYALKASGRGGTKMFHGYMRQESQRTASQLNFARVTVNKGSVVPYYQPKVDLKTGSIVGFEALLRWQHPTQGLQEPDSIAAAFKDFELASKLGEQMQKKILDDIVSWERRGIEFGNISFNAAPVEFLRDDYAERLLSQLEGRGLPASLVEVEVTEQVFLERGSELVRRALFKLSEAGVRISLDDFGTGHSSLSHLRDFPVDVVKIDRSFVAQMADDEEIASIVRSVINLAHSLSIDVVAEGIETNAQWDLLKVAGCNFGQGWLFGKPVSSDKIVTPFSRAA